LVVDLKSSDVAFETVDRRQGAVLVAVPEQPPDPFDVGLQPITGGLVTG
jgi:hypothetical protein